jgi:ribosomal subunit interface protein
MACIPDATKEYAVCKVQKFAKVYRLKSVEITMETQEEWYTERYTVKIAVSPKQGEVFIAAAHGTNWQTAINCAKNKVERQLHQHKEKIIARRIQKSTEHPEETVAEKQDSYEEIIHQDFNKQYVSFEPLIEHFGLYGV